MTVNPFDFGYTDDQVVMIPANSLLNLMFFANKVKENEPELGVLYEYPDSVENKRDDEGNLLESKIVWKEYGAKEAVAFFNNVDKPIRIATELSMLADQIIYSLGAIHEKNINAGVAKNLKEDNNDKVAQLLAKPDKKKK